MLPNVLKVTRNLKVLNFLLILSWLVSWTAAALFDGCDNAYNIGTGYSYLESPYYPYSYPSGTSCRYQFQAPLDHIIIANCTINLDKGSNGCTSEYFYVARDGDILLRDSEKFCGIGTFTRKTLFRTLVLAYTSNGSTGRFRCQFQVVPQPCDCGWSINTRISNGQEATVNEFPSIVTLKDRRSTYQLVYCGGSIVSHRHILTAAHCTRILPNPEYIEAGVGRHNLMSSPDTKYAAVYYISKIVEHPSYTSNPVNNDIAILTTTQNIEWSRGVGPICLPPSTSVNTNFAYDYVDVIGWGTTSFGGPTSSTLQKINLMITDYDTCSKAYKGISTIYKSQLCTYDYTGTSKDSCQFDSGGPAILKYNRQFLFLVALLSSSITASFY